MDIRVTFPAGPAGPIALVRFIQPGQEPEYRSLPLAGPLEEEMQNIVAFIWAHLEAGQGHQRQGFLWET
ncbi:hypothetical protein JCM15519_17100 [Fundidesulfovibrio butyratiphilus]